MYKKELSVLIFSSYIFLSRGTPTKPKIHITVENSSILADAQYTVS